MKTKLIGLLIACFAFTATAQDKALLETLVKKGMLTQQEAAQIAKESVTVTPGSKETKSIKLKGGVAGWYSWQQNDLHASGAEPQTNGFTLRYVKIGLEAEVGAGWTVDVMTDFGSEGAARNYLDKVVISKQINLDYLTGKLDFGMQKVNFGQEQNECDFNQLAIERSVATYFFTRPTTGGPADARKNFGSRAIGVFWNGTIAQVDGMYYGISVTGGNSYEGEGFNYFNNSNDGNNNLSFYANLGYKNVANVQDQAIAYDFGVNFGYASGGYAVETTNGYENHSVWGVNPYASIKWKGLTVMGEFFAQGVENGSNGIANYNGVSATPMGLNGTVAYKFDLGEWGALEPVARYSWVQSNGVGIYGINDYDSVFGQPFDYAKQVYVGVNWYAAKAVKFSVGYEWAQLTGGEGGSAELNSTYNTIRAQIQVVF